MKWIWALVLAAGLVAGYLVYRSAIEPSRRYSEMLETIRSYEDRPAADWSERDGERLWEHVAWFRLRNPRDLGRRLVESLHFEEERRSAARLSLAILGHDGYRDRSAWEAPGNDLPPPSTAEEGSFISGPFWITASLFSDDRIVGMLKDSPRANDRWLLLHAAWGGKASAAGQDAILAFAENDPDLTIRLTAQLGLGSGLAGPGGRSVLSKLVRDPLAAVRVTALAGLVQLGDAQSGRDLIFAVLAHGGPVKSEIPLIAVSQAANSLAADGVLGPELRTYFTEFDFRGADEGWELAERLGDVLERRAVEEYDEPLAE